MSCAFRVCGSSLEAKRRSCFFFSFLITVTTFGILFSQERTSGRSLSLPGRPSAFTSRAMSPTSPLLFQPAPDYFSKPDTAASRPGKRPTPWEAAARSPLGLVDEAFGPQNMQESIAANVVSAARRKTLPEPPDEWKQKASHDPPAPNGSVALSAGKQSAVVSPPKSSLSAPRAASQAASQLQYAYCSQRSRTEPDITSMDSRSDYCLSTADSNYSPQPRGWRRPTWAAQGSGMFSPFPALQALGLSGRTKVSCWPDMN